jgi:hypothetical protein
VPVAARNLGSLSRRFDILLQSRALVTERHLILADFARITLNMNAYSLIEFCDSGCAELTVLNGRLLHASTDQAHIASWSIRSISGASPCVNARPALRPAGFALRYFALGATGHARRQEQARQICRDSNWRNDHAGDKRFRRSIDPGRCGLKR